MGRFVLIFLILTGISMVVTTAEGNDGSKISEELLQQPPRLRKIQRLMVHFLKKTESSIANPPESNGANSEMESANDIEDEKEPNTEAQAPVGRKISRHHSSDKSVAGGGVIIGGLVTATFASVYCYIRVTRRKDGEKH